MSQRRQQLLPLPAAWPVPSREARAAADEAERVRRRQQAEQRAVDLFRATTQAVGVDALAAHADLDRSNLYAQARGTRPPQLSSFVAALRFDPDFGRVALESLAAEIGRAVVRRGEPTARRRPVGAVLRELEAVLADAGVLEGDEPAAATG